MAEEFSHKDAGVKLVATREKTRRMVMFQTAATCQYVEQTRKANAVHFVVDAFNGKVDSILSRIKNDNYGKLSQQIKDAFHLVNKDGKVFREARIEEEYLMSRLDELKWGVAVFELKRQEQEEQRKIKQEMREEEKARRDFEKAIREAEKEEKLISEIIAKAQEELATASEAQKEIMERKIAELQERLRIAEEKEQRAISMAEQTRRGHVYVISNQGSFGEDVYKIGLTRRLDPLERVRELGDASVPFPFDVHAMIYSEDAPRLENDLHLTFREKQVNKINNRKEFFRVNIAEIKSTISQLGIDAKWTLASETAEYRESGITH